MWLSQNGRHFAHDICDFIILYIIDCILIRLSLKFIPGFPIDNKPVWV